MTKLFVAGHSDSGDRFLPPGNRPWTALLCESLEQTTGEHVELQTKPFAPMGQRAVRYLLDAVESVQPDIVILPFSAYVCTVGVVSESVRARFGERAHRLYLRTESEFQAQTNTGNLRRAMNRGGRRAARAILGARTFATVGETAAIYEEILHGLAQFESLQVVGVADARFSGAVQAREPRLHARWDRLNARLKPIVEQHRFIWADLEAALGGANDRRIFHLDDGVHTTPAFHSTYFTVLREALAAPGRGSE